MTALRKAGVFRSAVTGADGTIDPGYLALFWLMVVVLNVIPFMCVLAAWSVFTEPKAPAGETIKSLGIGVGAVAGGFATALGAVGLFRWGDSRSPQAGAGVKPEDLMPEHAHPKPSEG